MNDPFYVVKSEVEQAVSGVQALFERWQQLVTSGGVGTDEFQWTTNELKSGLESIGWDVQELEETVSIVEKDPQRFNIDDAEIRSRKDFISATKGRVGQIESEIANPRRSQAARNMKNGDVNRQSKNDLMAGATNGGDRFSKLDNAIQGDNQKFIEDQTQQQQMIMRQQDGDLDELHDSVQVLAAMSQDMHNEFTLQEGIMDEYSNEVDNTQARMKRTLRKVDKLLDQMSERASWGLIIFLVFLLIGLIVIAVWV
eukprot:TRINITY_DN83_c0_g1_i1.p1 TRINITY_DN83_c0_g1~~TRINITY_DN83_c0_g1_i1.p1  ORF type:complete len:255 (-),score=52.93 TRINITY_DN83_c0_g1_i1:107-871(-)